MCHTGSNELKEQMCKDNVAPTTGQHLPGCDVRAFSSFNRLVDCTVYLYWLLPFVCVLRVTFARPRGSTRSP